MRRLMLLAVSILAVVSMAVSPAFADDRDGDGWDEDFGFWVLVPVSVNYDDFVIEEVEFEDGVLEDVEFEAV